MIEVTEGLFEVLFNHYAKEEGTRVTFGKEGIELIHKWGLLMSHKEYGYMVYDRVEAKVKELDRKIKIDHVINQKDGGHSLDLTRQLSGQLSELNRNWAKENTNE